MKKLSILFILLAFSALGQEKEVDSKIRKQIEDYNGSFAKLLEEGNTTEIIKAYTDSCIFMPEHSKQRTGKTDIDAFYKQWLKDTKIVSSQKTIFELQDLGDYILEIGNFNQKLQKKDNPIFTYSGKYMVLWQLPLKKDKTLKTTAEIWGSNTYFDDKELPEIDDTLITETKEYQSSDKLTEEVKERNQTIKELVKKRLGAEHAKLFMFDAIYLTYYSPMIVGIKDITDYFTEHEKPGTLSIDTISIKTSKIIKTKKAIIEFGYYSVDWSDGNSKGNVKGKSINVWKRNAAGELMLYRQIVNHD